MFYTEESDHLRHLHSINIPSMPMMYETWAGAMEQKMMLSKGMSKDSESKQCDILTESRQRYHFPPQFTRPSLQNCLPILKTP